MSFIYDKLLRPLAFRLDAETAHELGMKTIRMGLAGSAGELPKMPMAPRFGLHFDNPIGLAAGFDKNAKVVNQLAALGFGFVEVGTVTFRPQPGNDRPRLFRLPLDEALINRLGFNNQGAAKVANRLGALDRKCVVGVNIGKNKDVPIANAIENYIACLEIVHPVADYIAINISSPNTPNLRELQKGENFGELIDAIQQRNKELSGSGIGKPLLVKIAPDLSEADIEQITDSCVRFGIDGMIATNTTTSREGLATPNPDRFGPGGLSGRPLRQRATDVIAAIRRNSNGRMPIIGVGGVFSAADAFEKIAAGACLVQAYTGFVYKGPGFAEEIVVGLADILRERGFNTVDEAIGSGLKGL